MKKTSKEFMEWLGLKVGDRVEAYMEIIKATFEVRNDFTLLRLDNIPIPDTGIKYKLWDILDLDYKILPAPKRVGDLKCGKFECKNCPMKLICCNKIPVEPDNTLYQFYEELENNPIYDEFKDQEIYDLLKARLDKEVKDND